LFELRRGNAVLVFVSLLYIVTKHLMRQHKPGKTLQNFANRLRNIGGYWDFLILKDGFGVFLSNERI
ncbi:TPA: hypothetical protein ACFO2P_000453, partial [Neisseria meningitidis]